MRDIYHINYYEDRTKLRKEREQTINEMRKKALAVIKNWTRDGEDEIWTMANDWNRNHLIAINNCEVGEIFVCEIGNEDYVVIGFMIEDESYYYTED